MIIRPVESVVVAVTVIIPKAWVDRQKFMERIAMALEGGKGRRGREAVKTFEEISAILNGWIGHLDTSWVKLAKNVWDGTVDYTYYLNKSSLEVLE